MEIKAKYVAARFYVMVLEMCNGNITPSSLEADWARDTFGDLIPDACERAGLIIEAGKDHLIMLEGGS